MSGKNVFWVTFCPLLLQHAAELAAAPPDCSHGDRPPHPVPLATVSASAVALPQRLIVLGGL
eukprot:39699-Chlamydomonas_euryale.AAC.2